MRSPKLALLAACASALTLLLAFHAPPLFAATFEDAGIRIEIPEGYVGPVASDRGTSRSRGFRKPHPGSDLNTAILITVNDFGPSFAKQAATEGEALAREYLADFIGEIARNRTGFRAGKVQRVMISGVPAFRIGWSGAAQGIDFEGIVYCLVSGSRVIQVQVQDAAKHAKVRIPEASRAVERLRLVP